MCNVSLKQNVSGAMKDDIVTRIETGHASSCGNAWFCHVERKNINRLTAQIYRATVLHTQYSWREVDFDVDVRLGLTNKRPG